jgi:hypothetical protein
MTTKTRKIYHCSLVALAVVLSAAGQGCGGTSSDTPDSGKTAGTAGTTASGSGGATGQGSGGDQGAGQAGASGQAGDNGQAGVGGTGQAGATGTRDGGVSRDAAAGGRAGRDAGTGRDSVRRPDAMVRDVIVRDALPDAIPTCRQGVANGGRCVSGTDVICRERGGVACACLTTDRWRCR